MMNEVAVRHPSLLLLPALLLLLGPSSSATSTADGTCHGAIEVLSEMEPRLYYYPQFLSHAEADELISLASAKLQASTVGDHARDVRSRSSDICHMNALALDSSKRAYSHVVRRIQDRISAETKWSVDHFETLQAFSQYNQCLS